MINNELLNHVFRGSFVVESKNEDISRNNYF
jgi:hypothetical protein